jgi:hypothetical protein
MSEQTARCSRVHRLLSLGTVCTLGAVLSMLAALPAKAAPGRAARIPERESPPAQPPDVKLTLEPAEATWTWLLRLENRDSVPLRVVGDARLLSLDITPPPPKRGRAATIHCTLPAEMRPQADEESIQIVPPQLAYVETFDPRLYCFEAQKARALTAGATLVAHFGFAPSRARSPRPPFIVAPVDAEASRGASKEVVSESLTLPESLPALDEVSTDAPTSHLIVSTPRWIDASTSGDLTLPITVSNATQRNITLLLRPETIAIDASGPSGTTRCQWLIVPSPIAELFTTLPPKGRASTEVLVSVLCPRAFFDRSGLYALRAAIDTRRASGASIGIHSFDGEVWSRSTTLVRIRTVSHSAARLP